MSHAVKPWKDCKLFLFKYLSNTNYTIDETSFMISLYRTYKTRPDACLGKFVGAVNISEAMNLQDLGKYQNRRDRTRICKIPPNNPEAVHPVENWLNLCCFSKIRPSRSVADGTKGKSFWNNFWPGSKEAADRASWQPSSKVSSLEKRKIYKCEIQPSQKIWLKLTWGMVWIPFFGFCVFLIQDTCMTWEGPWKWDGSMHVHCSLRLVLCSFPAILCLCFAKYQTHIWQLAASCILMWIWLAAAEVAKKSRDLFHFWQKRQKRHNVRHIRSIWLRIKVADAFLWR